MKTTTRKRTLVFGLILMLIVTCLLTACGSEPVNRNPYNLKVLDATSDFYVNDFAGILSNEQKSEMMNRAVSMDSEYSGIQVVVSVVESFDKTVVGYDGKNTPRTFEIEQVAYAMFSQYGIGQDDMGILVLFSVNDRKVRIETGYQMQTYITDIKSGQLLDDYGMEYFRNDQFAEGLVSVQAAVIEEIKNVVPIDWATSITVKETENNQETAPQEVVNPENAIIKIDAKENAPNDGLLIGFFGILATLIAAIVALIYNAFTGKKQAQAHAAELESQRSSLLRKHQAEIANLKSEHQDSLEEKNRTIASLRAQLTTKSTTLSHAQATIDILNDKYARAQKLHPEFNFEQEIVDMIEGEYQDSARIVDEKLSHFVTLPADKDRINLFQKALDLFDSARPEVRKYIKADRNIINALYDKSVSLKKAFDIAEQEKADKRAANQAYQKIKAIYNDNPNGNRLSYKALNNAYIMYTELTSAQRNFFPDMMLIQALERLVRAAKTDYDNYNNAQKAEREVKSVVDYMSSADEDDRNKLARAKRAYDNLTSEERAYFDSSLLSKLQRLIRQAEDDHTYQERKRRERRMQQSSSHSSSYHRSSSSHRTSYSGRGGRPGGGGASRGF